ncbi:MAG: phosphoadenylyl-sulfate reductase [Candidatus Hydrogenedentes bacterium]|nr:phosphoadenylyl-sulfate reductase [Candidatus Hydrogenedentota bacterium]
MTILENQSELLDRLEAMSPEEMLTWAHTNHGDRAGIITSFQDTGTVMVDMSRRCAPGLRVITIDTLRLHPETYELMDAIEKRYGITVERFQPDPERLQKMVAQHGEFLFFDSKPKQEFCCKIRKVEPNERALASLDVWITGLRRDQSAARKVTPRASWIDRNGRALLKLAPLADWSEEQVRQYVKKHDLPYNTLYDKGYSSIGCVICSTPTLPLEDKRAGRWRWFNHTGEGDKECGIHIGGSGI